MALYKCASSSKSAAPPIRTEFDILKASHKYVCSAFVHADTEAVSFRFLREDDKQEDLSWDEQLAKKYYSNLYREYAVCDLKHYKSGNVGIYVSSEPVLCS